MSGPVGTSDGASLQQLLPPDSTLGRAWLTIAFHPTRRVFTEIARIATREWIITSLAVSAVLSLIANLLNLLQMSLQPVRTLPTGNAHIGFSLPVLPPTVAVVVLPIISIIASLAIAYAVALIMPTDRGALWSRSYLVLGALALAQTVGGAANLLGQIAMTALVVAVRSGGNALTCVNGLIGLGLLIYSVALTVNALSASSGKGRWAVFGVYLLTALVLVTVLWYVPAGIVQALAVHHSAR